MFMNSPVIMADAPYEIKISLVHVYNKSTQATSPQA